MSDLKIDAAWVKGLRAWVKKTFAPKPYRTPEEARAHVQRLLKVEFPRLEEYLMLKHGMRPFPDLDPKYKTILDKMRDKVSTELAAAREALDDADGRIRFYLNAVTPGTSEYEYREDMRKHFSEDPDALMRGVKDFAEEGIGKAEAILSGKLLRFLTSWLAKYSDGIPFETQEVLSEYAIGKMKFVWDADSFPKSQRRDPRSLKDYIQYLKKAKALLDRRGFGFLWYGTTLISCKGCGGDNQYGAELGVGGHYRIERDRVVIFSDPRDFITELMIHELGHRYYFKFMNQGDRARFDSYFGEVAAVSEYGKKHTWEDFAEVFLHYVLGEDLSRDQIDRFKAFLADKDRKRQASPQDPIVRSIQNVLERHGHGGSYAEEIAYEVQGQLAERMASRVALRFAASRRIGPVYHVQRNFDLKDNRPTYWSKKPRVGEFGRFVFKANITLKNPYFGSDHDAREVVMALPKNAALALIKSLDLDDEDPQDEGMWDRLAREVSDRHSSGIWQGPEMIKAIRHCGFDGVLSSDPFGGEAEYVTFSTRQVEVLETFEGTSPAAVR